MDTPATPLILISVVHWNTAQLSARCLQAVAALDYPNYRVALVDNGSVDSSADALVARFPGVRLLRSAGNPGFAAGHALALAHARQLGAAAIWLLNSDCEVRPETLTRLVEAWSGQGDAIYGALPLRRGADGRDQLDFPARFLQPGIPRTPWLRERPLRIDAGWRQQSPFTVAAVPGSCMLLPLAVVDQAGWMDDCWFLYCEELDYCLRLAAAGIQSVLVAQASVLHAGGGSHAGRSHVGDCVAYYQSRNEIQLQRRHGGRAQALLVGIKKLLRALSWLPRRPQRGWAVLRGVVDAWRGRMGKTLAPEQALQRDLRRKAD